MRLSFFGACREVTGSNIFIEANGAKILFECGLFQGYKFAEERNFEEFGFNASEIDFVILGHAHLDHVGRIPKLVKEGFRGKVICTAPTKELAQLVLEDSEKLMREDAERNNSRVLYTNEHLELLGNLFEIVPYGIRKKLAADTYVTLNNAGHILGSSTIFLEADGVSLAYSSDLGNTPSLLLDPPGDISNADYLICESTYGGRVHEDAQIRQTKLAEIITSVVEDNGVLMIPSFAIERTQELLHDIDHFCTNKKCEKPKFFLDSPLAEKVTGVYKNFPKYFSGKLKSSHPDNDFFGLGRIDMTTSVDESKAINDVPSPKIIIAGSGMMNGGRILFHLRKYLPDAKNTLLIIGYQAQGTLGRRIFEGASKIKIFREEIPVRAKVMAIGSYSAHADKPQLVDWISKINGLKKVFLVHGEGDQSVSLSKTLEEKLKLSTIIPQRGEQYEIGKTAEEEVSWQRSYPGY